MLKLSQEGRIGALYVIVSLASASVAVNVYVKLASSEWLVTSPEVMVGASFASFTVMDRVFVKDVPPESVAFTLTQYTDFVS